MTAREKLHRLLDELPASELEPVLEFIVSRREKDQRSAARARPRLELGCSTDGVTAAEAAIEPVARPTA
jgi:hypothetical protein